MKKYQVKLANKIIEIVQDDDGKFVKPDFIKENEKYGSTLKPAFEPIIVARKPFKTSLVDNVLKNGVGALNIDECRVDLVGNEDLARQNKTDNGMFGVGNNNNNNAELRKEAGLEPVGRFPANVILTYDETDKEEVTGGFPEGSHTGHRSQTSIENCIENRKLKKGNSQCDIGGNIDHITEYTDYGSASRYFYCAKASKRDRDEGLDGFEEKKVNDGRQAPVDNAFQRGETPRKNTHPTVKPTSLMQYLVRLVSPKGSTILDCFNGSGSTGKAVMYENKERDANYKYIGIEMTEEYLPIAKARIEYVENLKDDKQTSLF